MKYFLLCLVVAFVVPSYGMSFNRRNFNFDMKTMMYAAGGTAQCDVCEMVVGDIQTVLKGREPEVQSLLDSLCEDLPAAYRSNCTSIVDAYLPIIFALINDMTPEEVCELLTLCSTTSTDMPEFNGRRSSPSSIINYLLRSASRMRALRDRRINYFRNLVGENYLCDACEDTIGFIHEAVACNYTWGMVAEFFGPLCEVCPSQWRDSCVRFFADLPGDVNDFANEYLDPLQDCEIFGFCAEMIIDEGGLQPYMEETEEVVEELEPELEEENEQEVIEVLEVIPMPRRVDVDVKEKLYNARRMKKLGKTKNKKRMEQRGMDTFRRRLRRAIIVSIGGREDVNVIPYDVTHDLPVPGYEAVPAHKKCEVCRYFSSAAAGVLEYNEEDITNGLDIVFEDICKALPDKWQTDCETEIRDVLPGVIYQAAVTIMNPEYLCNEVIGICQ